MTTAWQTRAFAKINLHLEVLGRRADGYHDLATVFQTIGLADRLVAEPHDGPFALVCPGSDLPADGRNLVWRAAVALAEATGSSTDGWRVTLHKTIPTQAGLGGGSSDAMAALRLLARAWEAPVDRDLLAAIGSRLGSDVAFFAEGGTALGTGRGERLTPLVDLPPLQVVIARPSFGVPTGDAYGWVAGDREGGMRAAGPGGEPPEWPVSSEDWGAVLPACWNDFEPVVCARHPVLAAAIADLRAAGALHALLSGSGSAVAGVFAEPGAAARAVAGFEGRPGWTAWGVPTISRAAHLRDTAPQRVVLPLRSGYV